MMDNLAKYIEVVMETSGIFAPFLFILLHVIRPLLLIPVMLLCIMGGLLFGIIPGIIYSIIGVSISSLIFFRMAHSMPSTTARLSKMKQKVFGKDVSMTTGQISVLRLIPFVHYHLLSFLIYESADHIKTYFRASLVSSIPIVVIYTTIGQSITELSPLHSTGMLIGIVPVFFMLRRKESVRSIREFLHVEMES